MIPEVLKLDMFWYNLKCCCGLKYWFVYHRVEMWWQIQRCLQDRKRRQRCPFQTEETTWDINIKFRLKTGSVHTGKVIGWNSLLLLILGRLKYITWFTSHLFVSGLRIGKQGPSTRPCTNLGQNDDDGLEDDCGLYDNSPECNCIDDDGGLYDDYGFLTIHRSA